MLGMTARFLLSIRKIVKICLVSAAFLFANFLFVEISMTATSSAAATVGESTGGSTVGTILDRALSKANELKLHEREEWRRLVLYRSTWSGGWKSEADGLAFFVSPAGPRNPQAELQATLRGFFDPNPRLLQDPKTPSQAVRCQFPARWKWLSTELGLKDSDLPVSDCKDFQTYHAKLNAHSATLVFSAYYVNSASSAFGHTLLRINQNAGGPSSGRELIDMGINYAANPTTSNAALYTLMGMIGGFPGTFSNLHYYYKVREYADFESRDLWEYNLNLTQDEVEQLVAHIWELGSTYFDYYYFDENCSYHLLALLDAAAPRLNLIKRLHFYVIPIDTVKAVTAEPGLLGDVHLRPSIHSQLSARLETLDKNELAAFDRLLNKKAFEKADIQNLAPDAAAHVLDAVADGIDFRYTKELIAKDARIISWKQDVLVTRSRLPMTPAIIAKSAVSSRPDLSHNSARFSLGGGRDRRNEAYGRAQLRFALHDWLDPEDGYPALSSVEFMKLTGRYEIENKKMRLDDLRLVSVSSLAPLTRYSRALSWSFQLGADRIQDSRCVDCLASVGSWAGGGSISLGSRLTSYLLAGPGLAISGAFIRENWTAEMQAIAGLRWAITPRWLTSLEAEHHWIFDRIVFNNQHIELISRWSPNLRDGAEVNVRWGKGAADISASYIRYF